MSKQLEQSFAKFNELMLKVVEKSTIGVKRYASDLLLKLYEEYTIMEKSVEMYRGKPTDQYTDDLEKCVAIFSAMGMGRIDFELIEKEFVTWLSGRKLKEPINFEKMYKLNRLYKLFRTEHNREPENFNEIKNMINELNLTGYEQNT